MPGFHFLGPRKVHTYVPRYPQYPRAWLRSLSEADNEAREQYDNDRSVNGQSVNIAVPGDPVVADPAQPVTPAIPSALIPASDYPAAYRSILALNEDDDWSPSSSLSSLSSSTTVTTAMTSSSSPSPSTTVTTATTSSSPSPSSAHHSPGRICRYIYDSQCL